MRFRDQRNSLEGVRVAILGVGAVGMELARLLHEAGAVLTVADVDPAAAATAGRLYGATVVEPDACIAADVDVFSPCALGGSINADTVGLLKAGVVAGAANNQLLTPDMDARLKDRGVLYAPDYVINGAGVISVGLEILGAWSAAEMNRRIDGIGATLTDIFLRAAREDRPTGAVADQMAQEIIERARQAA